MRNFNSLLAFSEHLLKAAAAEELAAHAIVKRAAAMVKKTARSEFGHYQPEIGDYVAWAELADSTKSDRVREGWSENDPLLRSGELMDSVKTEVHGRTAVVGSESEIMLYMEVGTDKMPPRPVLGPAYLRNKERIHKVAETVAVATLFEGKLSGHQGLDNE
jgi:HK97 gp10 family phage protein